MIPTTIHKGFKITFSDEMEDWSCRELGKRSKSLKNLRSQIDNHVRNIRKGVAVDALRLPYVFGQSWQRSCSHGNPMVAYGNGPMSIC